MIYFEFQLVYRLRTIKQDIQDMWEVGLKWWSYLQSKTAKINFFISYVIMSFAPSVKFEKAQNLKVSIAYTNWLSQYLFQRDIIKWILHILLYLLEREIFWHFRWWPTWNDNSVVSSNLKMMGKKSILYTSEYIVLSILTDKWTINCLTLALSGPAPPGGHAPPHFFAKKWGGAWPPGGAGPDKARVRQFIVHLSVRILRTMYSEVYKMDFLPIIFRFDDTTELSFQVGHHLKCQKISRSSKYSKICKIHLIISLWNKYWESQLVYAIDTFRFWAFSNFTLGAKDIIT